AKIVVISSISHHDKMNVIKNLGCDAYITKPFEKETILGTLRQLGLIAPFN
ncbi:MAG: response regulator, partial [Calditrichaeota bacterium]